MAQLSLLFAVGQFALDSRKQAFCAHLRGESAVIGGKNRMDYSMGFPTPQGLYDPSNEHDACGVGFVAHIKGAQSHAIISQALFFEIKAGASHLGAARPS